jgi:hypothetical protein
VTIDFAGVNTAALAACPGILQQWLPAGRLLGREYRCGDLSGGPGKSLSVNIETGAWADFATDAKGGDLVSLYAAVRGLRPSVAAIELAETLGIPQAAPSRSEGRKQCRQDVPRDPDPIIPVPAGVPAPSFRHGNFGQPSSKWEYLTGDGELIGYICRWDPPEGKETLPYVWTANGWAWKSFPKPRPLYGLDRLAQRPDAPVLIVEGEKCADAAVMLLPAYVVVAWPGGAQAFKYADLSPLKGRKILLWPDADEPGIKAMNDLATLLDAAEVKILDPSGQPKGWDAADALAEGWNKARTLEWAKDRVKVWEPPPPPSPPASTQDDPEGPSPDAPDWAFDPAPDEPSTTRPRGPNEIRVLSLEEVLQLPKRQQLVKGVIGMGELSMWYGPSGSGKSFLLTHIALHIATGRAVFGRKVAQGPILYVAAEGVGGWPFRLEAFHNEYGLSLAAPASIIPHPVDLAEPGIHVESVISEARRRNSKLIVVDTVARNLGQAQEDEEGFGSLIRACDRIRTETGAHVALVHHTGKDKTRGARGHSSLIGAVDTSIEIDRPDEKSSSRTVRIAKQKDGVDGPWISFELRVVELAKDEDGDPITSCIITEIDMDEVVRRRGRPAGQKGIAYSALVNLFASDAGYRPEGLGGVPSQVTRVIDVRFWRESAFRAGICDSDANEDAKRKAFHRAKVALIETGYVSNYQSGKIDVAWLVGQQDMSGTSDGCPDDE